MSYERRKYPFPKAHYGGTILLRTPFNACVETRHSLPNLIVRSRLWVLVSVTLNRSLVATFDDDDAFIGSFEQADFKPLRRVRACQIWSA